MTIFVAKNLYTSMIIWAKFLDADVVLGAEHLYVFKILKISLAFNKYPLCVAPSQDFSSFISPFTVAFIFVIQGTTLISVVAICD